MTRSSLQGSGSTDVCCGGRSVFYLHIIMLVVVIACTVSVWIVIRRFHSDTVLMAQLWSKSYDQLLHHGNIRRYYLEMSLENHPNIDAVRSKYRLLMLDELGKFDRHHKNAHAAERQWFRSLVAASDTEKIEKWLAFCKDFLGSGFKYDLPARNQVKTISHDAHIALTHVVEAYRDRMEKTVDERADLTGMVFLAISTLVVVGLMFLVRAEFLQQQATIQLAEELASVIHDVRTPQQVIVSAVALISQTSLDSGAVADLIQVISDSCSATQRLLDTALIRVRAKAAPEPVPLPSVFQSVSNIQGIACRDKGLTWRCDIDPSSKIAVFVDSDAILQIVNNIVSNAIRYTDTGLVALSIKVLPPKPPKRSCLRGQISKSHTLVITVTDTGRGIPRESMAIIFKKFRQVKSGSGFGIGLFTVSRLTNSVNGRIDLWSEPGRGTRFVVSVPVLFSSALPDDPTKAAGAGSLIIPIVPAAPRPPAVKSAHQLGIILLDDDPITTKLSQRILITAGHSVRVFMDGNDVLNQYHGADVIVSDLNMPEGMNGLEVAKRLRKSGFTGALIAHTGDHFAHSQCISSGFDSVLPKPTTALIYVETIEKIYAKKSGQKRVRKVSETSRNGTDVDLSD